jgi:hypothetical protein
VLDHPTLPDLIPGLVSYQLLIFDILTVINAYYVDILQISCV